MLNARSRGVRIHLLYTCAMKGHSMKIATCLLLLAAAVMLAQPQRPVEEFKTSAGVVKITPVRHASMIIEAGGKVIHVDPWSQGNYEGLPKAELILIADI